MAAVAAGDLVRAGLWLGHSGGSGKKYMSIQLSGRKNVKKRRPSTHGWQGRRFLLFAAVTYARCAERYRSLFRIVIKISLNKDNRRALISGSGG